jgi:hypothetical protein
MDTYAIWWKGKNIIMKVISFSNFFQQKLNSNNEIILGVNHCNIPRIIQVIIDCIMKEGIVMENVTAIRMVNICKHVQVNIKQLS